MLPWCPGNEHLSMGGRLGFWKTILRSTSLPAVKLDTGWQDWVQQGRSCLPGVSLHQIETKSELQERSLFTHIARLKAALGLGIHLA